jgi:hypothetical protein
VTAAPPKRRGGRPRANVDGHEVVRLRAAGQSWPAIANRLGVGTATAMRAYKAVCCIPKPSQNSRRDPHVGVRPELAGTKLSNDFDSGVPWPEWKARSLNRLFLVQGARGKPGRITAATVEHGERRWS